MFLALEFSKISLESKRSGCAELHLLIRQHVYDATRNDAALNSGQVPTSLLPVISDAIYIHQSATVTYLSPTDLCKTQGVRHEIIRSVPDWRQSGPRRDTVLLNMDPDQPGMRGMDVASVQLFFSFKHLETVHQCALVHWFLKSNGPHDAVDMWVVNPDFRGRHRKPFLGVVPLDTIIRACHLIPCYRDSLVPHGHSHMKSLTTFESFYVNRFVDLHAFEIIF